MIFRLTQKLGAKIKAGQLAESPMDENLNNSRSPRQLRTPVCAEGKTTLL